MTKHDKVFTSFLFGLPSHMAATAAITTLQPQLCKGEKDTSTLADDNKKKIQGFRRKPLKAHQRAASTPRILRNTGLDCGGPGEDPPRRESPRGGHCTAWSKWRWGRREANPGLARDHYPATEARPGCCQAGLEEPHMTPPCNLSPLAFTHILPSRLPWWLSW